ncbi:PTS sugar transporter subunit IIA [Paenibacillus alkaliterrae]|uniref:PTS sugar transporter subunit IIA n=1 Tax=Paenibacillus alkaliterrae TaxID=320909 RepID=UPI001F2686DA|nr:PTS sugar transporter subunit IIA [Paenibacillus alkaliterrae]MCF2938435.1 PTS sugar transporter subunit IIA [Paenibacillus alkaliterrae]
MNRINRIGRFMSNLVFQNIAGLIVLGLIRVLFSERGWFPVPAIDQILDPTLKYYLPILFAFTGGRMIGGHRGGVIASFVMMGMIAGNTSDYSMLMPAMAIGPLAGFIIARTDRWLAERIPVGLELLCYNFAAGLIGALLALTCFFVVADWFVIGMHIIQVGAELVLASNYLAWVALAIEPGKVLFLNNIINHGILEPLGIHQTKEIGHSIFFLLESNPGPGFGLLLAYFLLLKGKEKDNARSSLLIQGIGGIHEVYFPYALMKPVLIMPLIAAGLTGNWVFQLLQASLVATPSPGSIILLMIMAPKGMQIPVLSGVLSSAVISFFGCYFILRRQQKAPAPVSDAIILKNTPEGDIQLSEQPRSQTIRKIYFACDAGMGSSAMGAALLRKKLKQAGLSVEVGNCSVDEIPQDSDMVISQVQLTDRARKATPGLQHLSINTFMDAGFYDELILQLQGMALRRGHAPQPESGGSGELFTEKHVLIGAQAEDKWQAVRQVGELMVGLGLVKHAYIASMIEREKMLSTLIGNGVAIPHGVDVPENAIVRTGIVIVQYPEGVDFDNGQKAYLLISVVSADQQGELMSRVAFMIENKDMVKALVQSESEEEAVRIVRIYLQ